MNRFTPTRLTQLSLAISLVFSGGAQALLPTDGTPDISLYLPGSQANDPVLGFPVANSVIDSICADKANIAGTTTHVYFQALSSEADSAAKNDSYSGIYCLTSTAKLASILGTGAASTLTTAGSYVVDATHPAPATAPYNTAATKIKVWISRRRLGASAVGLSAASTNSPLGFIKDPSNCGTTTSTSGSFSYTSGGTTFQYNFACHLTPDDPLDTFNVALPTGATGDVTPDVMGAEDNTVPNTTPIDYNLFTTRRTVAGHIIGTPVTLKLYQALQLAGIVSGSLPSDCGLAGQGVTPITANASGENAACQPSLTKAQVASIFSGAVADWTALKVKLPTPATTGFTPTDTDAVADNVIDLPELVAQAKAAGFAGTGTDSPVVGTGDKLLDIPLDTTVHVCRRENGAGQQVAVMANILQYPCLDNHGPRIADTGSSNADFMYATSLGAVDSCLNDLNNGSNTYFSGTNSWNGTVSSPAVRHNPAPYNDYRDIPQNVAHGNQWGISIQTTERNASRGSNYRFIKIDGASPTGKEVAQNRYPLVGEYTFSWRGAYNTSNLGTSKGNDVNKLQNGLVKVGQLAATVAARNTSLSNHGWGQAGYVALSANVAPPAGWDPANPVSPYVRQTAGQPDACALPVLNTNYNNLSLPTP
ncbi:MULTISPECIES: hypothetical protein [Methylomonas]|uniref:PBP domain-containing protein n=1 Tax=Methylomonas koyamae TaxID=702114 RepID=A0A177NUB9_9GAMM|nr:hypothetical protein [Methylomonas koyamae]OAI21392.1 hypothetical protein A1355_02635 [Methylomonas koyamae]